MIGIGALLGVLLGGYVSHWFTNRGWISARIVVGGTALLLAVLCFAPGVGFRLMATSMPLLTAGAFFLGAANPTIAAARLDLLVPRMWGRGEASSMAARSLLEGGAPLLFGAVSVWLGRGLSGLTWTFLLMLIPLLIRRTPSAAPSTSSSAARRRC